MILAPITQHDRRARRAIFRSWCCSQVPAFQVIAGALLMLGLFVAPAALGLAAFTLTASVMLLNFWSLPGGIERQIAVTVWPCNIAIIGGLLVTAAGVMPNPLAPSFCSLGNRRSFSARHAHSLDRDPI